MVIGPVQQEKQRTAHSHAQTREIRLTYKKIHSLIAWNFSYSRSYIGSVRFAWVLIPLKRRSFGQVSLGFQKFARFFRGFCFLLFIFLSVFLFLLLSCVFLPTSHLPSPKKVNRSPAARSPLRRTSRHRRGLRSPTLPQSCPRVLLQHQGRRHRSMVGVPVVAPP